MPIPTLTAIAAESAERRGPADDRPLLVLGPSLGTSTRLWQDVAARLRDDHRVLAFDLPGHGRSAPAAAPFTMSELAAGVIALVDDLGEERFHYAGDSIGGAIGLTLLVEHPERVAAAAIVCSGAKIGTPEAWAERAALVRAQSTSALVVGSAQRWFAPGSMEREPEASGELLHTLRETDAESYARCCEALAGYDLRDRLGEIAAPVLVIAGAHDEATPLALSQEIADGVADARLVVAERSAHLAPAEEPDLVAGALADFLGGAR